MNMNEAKIRPTSLINHFAHRQELEIRICEEVFDGMYTLLKSKEYRL